MTDSVLLPVDWYVYCVERGVDVDRPGIYEWRIDGVGSYIGRYGRVRRPTKEYARNVVRLLNDKPYRKNKPHGFRRIHFELAKAVKAGTHIKLLILENVGPEVIALRERELIRERGTLND